MSLITLQIKGMICRGCALSVETLLGRFPGITYVRADHNTGLVQVEFFDNPPQTMDLLKAIRKIGFTFKN